MQVVHPTSMLAARATTVADLEQGTPVPITRLRAQPHPFAYSSGLEESLRLVVRDAESWRSTWERMQRHQRPQPPLPQVDFAREMLIVAALGSRPSGGYSILVEAAHEHPAHLVVTIRKTSPGVRCFVSGTLTQPVDVARLPRSEKPVYFREIHTVHERR